MKFQGFSQTFPLWTPPKRPPYPIPPTASNPSALLIFLFPTISRGKVLQAHPPTLTRLTGLNLCNRRNENNGPLFFSRALPFQSLPPSLEIFEMPSTLYPLLSVSSLSGVTSNNPISTRTGGGVCNREPLISMGWQKTLKLLCSFFLVCFQIELSTI